MVTIGPDLSITLDPKSMSEILEQTMKPLRELWSRRGENNLTKKVTRAVEGILSPHLIEYLKWRYRHEPFLERCGLTYPVAVYPALQAQRDVDTILCELLPSTAAPSPEIFRHSEYRETVTQLDLLSLTPDRNVTTFMMRELSVKTGEPLRMTCEYGTYFDSLDSCEALEWELRLAVERLPVGTPLDCQAFERARLPQRHALHERVDAPARVGQRRSVAIGLSTAIVFHNGHGYEMLMRRRGRVGQALRVGCLHVVPSCMFQAVTRDPPLEFSVSHNIFREYLEELFDIKLNPDRGDHESVHAHPLVVSLKEMLSAGRAQLILTGVTVNLMNLRPDICALLVIHDPGWYRDSTRGPSKGRWRFNDEFASATDTLAPLHMGGGRIPMGGTDRELIVKHFLYPPFMVPAGAGAFWLAVDACRKLAR